MPSSSNLPENISGLPRFSLMLTLKSGKQVSFSEGGDRAGIPVIFVPGANGNRMWTAIYDNIARENGIRLICFDRPGRGVSEHPNSLKDWSFESLGDYLDELTDMLEIPKFFIMAHSCGASYIMASYPRLKEKIIGALRIMAIWAPTTLPCMPSSYALARSLPTSMVRALYSFSSAAKLSTFGKGWKMGRIGDREMDCVSSTPTVSSILNRMGEENLGSDYKAYEADWLLSLEITKPMGFNYKELPISIKCWHGMDDDIVPLGTAMWMQREIPKFLLFAVEGGTHNILLDLSIIRAIFSDIVKEATQIRMNTFQNRTESQESQESLKDEEKSVTALPDVTRSDSDR